MAKYKSIVITNAGLKLIAATHSGGTIQFTGIKTGNGTYDGSEVLADMTDLKSIKQTFGITGLTREDSVVKLRSILSNENLTEGYYITEIGLYALEPESNSEILYAIALAEDGSLDYFSPFAEAPQSITLELYITATGAEEGVTFKASIVTGVYATVQDLEDYREENTAEHDEINRNVNAVTENVNAFINSHVSNTDNPHNVTKKQVGLENVPNVATNDQEITYSEAADNANLTSGEKLSVAFGKIAKAVKSLISHLADKNNPHGVTKTDVGLGDVDNTSDANKPVSTLTQSAIDSCLQDAKDYCDDKLAGCWISFTDAAGNPTTKPYVHWMEEVADTEAGDSV